MSPLRRTGSHLTTGVHGAFTVPLEGKLAVVDTSACSAFFVVEGKTHMSNNTTWKVESGELKSAKIGDFVQMIQKRMTRKNANKPVTESI